jgi:hypothetical protein
MSAIYYFFRFPDKYSVCIYKFHTYATRPTNIVYLDWLVEIISDAERKL